MADAKIWTKILGRIKKEVSASTFKTWFLGSRCLEYKKTNDKNILIVAFRNNFLKEEVEKRYLAQITRLAKRELSEEVEILAVVAPAEKIKPKGKEPIFSGIAPAVFIKSRSADDLNLNHTFDNFVVGSSNNLAYLVAKQVAANPGTNYNPFLVWGDTGVGKTHLMQAIGNEIKKTAADAKILYASSERFTNDYLESLANKTQAHFRAKYRSCDVLLIDDIQFLAGKESTQDQFFYTFNELILSTKQIVIASDRHPRELGKFKERLVSRFLQGMVADIAPADLEMKMAILRIKCRQRGLELNDESISYIAGELAGARELEGAVVATFSQAKLSGTKIGLEMIKSVVEKTQSQDGRVSPETVISAVSNYFGVEPADLVSPSRKSNLVSARQVLMFLLRKELHLSLEQIGQLVGGRDHSTIIHGVEKVGKDVAVNQLRRDEILRIKSLFNSTN